MTSPVDFISGPSGESTDTPSMRNRFQGMTASFTAIGAESSTAVPSPWRRRTPASRSCAMLSPSMSRAAAFMSWVLVAFDTNGTVRDARGFASSTYSTSPCSAYWMFGQPLDADPARDRLGRFADAVDDLLAERDRRQRARRVAGMDPGLLDVLHDAAQVELGAVVGGVHVDLDRVVEEPVDQHRRLRGDEGRAVDHDRQGLIVVDDLHAAAAQHVRGPHEHRVPDRVRDGDRLLRGLGHAALRGRQAGRREHVPNSPRSSARSIDSGRGPDDQDAVRLERARELQGDLPASLHDHARDRAVGELRRGEFPGRPRSVSGSK